VLPSRLSALARLTVATALSTAALAVMACQPAAPTGAPTTAPLAATSPSPAAGAPSPTASAPAASPAASPSPAAGAPTTAPGPSPVAQPLPATGVLAQVRARGVLRVANPQTSPPFSLRDERDELVGFDVDVANEVARLMGVARVEFIQGTFDTFIPGVQADRWDVVIAGQAVTEERKQQVDFSDPYRLSGVSIFVNQANDSIRTLDDLRGKRVGLVSGAAQIPLAERAGAEVRTYENAILALTDLGFGRADAYLGSRFVGAYLAEKNGIRVRPTPGFLEIEQNAMSFKKGEAALKAEVDQAIQRMIADGTLTAISKKWLGPEEDMAAELRRLGSR
jgi:L-cystine transport system substrate-binding protein